MTDNKVVLVTQLIIVKVYQFNYVLSTFQFRQNILFLVEDKQEFLREDSKNIIIKSRKS